MSSLAARFLPSRKTALGIVALCALGVAGWLSARMGTGTIEELGIGDRAEHYPPELSGGQQQRVAVARALANQPELILADEPTAAPDGQRGRQVMELFRRIAHERGTAAIVVTHDHRALDVFDTIYELEDGLIRHGDQPAPDPDHPGQESS